MFPIILNLADFKVVLIGGGDSALRRLKLLDEAKAYDVKIFADNFGREFWEIAGKRLITRMPTDEELKRASAIMVVDVPDDVAADIAERARSLGVLVNVEDKKEYCDFYYPSVVRQGDLIIAVSTSGKSPTLAKRIREVIGKIFYGVWRDRLEEIAVKRAEWQDLGLDMQEVANMSNKYIDEKGWLEYEELVEKEVQESRI